MLVIPFILGLQPQSVVSRRPLKQKQKTKHLHIRTHTNGKTNVCGYRYLQQIDDCTKYLNTFGYLGIYKYRVMVMLDTDSTKELKIKGNVFDHNHSALMVIQPNLQKT